MKIISKCVFFLKRCKTSRNSSQSNFFTCQPPLETTTIRLCQNLALVAAGTLVAALNVPTYLILLNQPQPTITVLTSSTSPKVTTNIELPPLSSNFSQNNNLEAPPDTAIGCYHQAPGSHQYRPIVLEDCYPMHERILLSPNVLTPRAWNPQSTREHYRRQNGNCIFRASPGIRAVPSSFSEIEVGVFSARIVRECVNARTGYFGGQKQYSASLDWVISIFAVGPP